MNSDATDSFTLVGMMKNAFILPTARRSWSGTRCISPEIRTSADARALGLPVMIAEPRSAAYSR